MTVLVLCLKLEYPAHAIHIVQVELNVVFMPQLTLLPHHGTISQSGIQYFYDLVVRHLPKLKLADPGVLLMVVAIVDQLALGTLDTEFEPPRPHIPEIRKVVIVVHLFLRLDEDRSSIP